MTYDLVGRAFALPAPEHPNHEPGRLGALIGWMLVRLLLAQNMMPFSFRNIGEKPI